MVADLSAVRGSSDRGTVLSTIRGYIPTLGVATADSIPQPREASEAGLSERRAIEPKQTAIGKGVAA
jgi:hypothetical protein